MASATASKVGVAGPIDGPATPALELRSVSKSFNGRVVLDLDALDIARGEIHALVGQNGSGKTTLIKILAGYHEADPGTQMSLKVAGVELSAKSQDLARGAGLRFVHQDLALVASMSILDNIYMGRKYPTRALTVRSRTAEAEAREALARVGLASLDLAARAGDLSPAEKTGVAIARALAADDAEAPNILVLDEPTATLPAPEIDGLLKILEGVAKTGVAILYVTHHLDEVFKISTNVSVLRDGKMVASGPTASFTRDQIVHNLVGTELEAIHRSDATSANDNLMEPTDAVLVVDKLVSDWINGMSFSVAAGEIVGFYGVTGSGRDSVLGAIFGARERSGGEVRIAGQSVPANSPDRAIQLGLGFVPANRKTHGGVMELTAMENLTLPALRPFWHRGRLDVAAEEAETNAWFARLGVRPESGARLPLTNFSGGNQQKIILAKWLRQKPTVLLLDEPTQGVDVGAKAVIHRTILDAVGAGLAVVIASSDDEEMAALCSKVHVVAHGHIVDTLVADEISEVELGRRLNALDRQPSPDIDGDQS